MNYSAVLTKKIKELLYYEISDHFSRDPIFRKKLKVVNHRSDLEDITYGVIFRSVSANKLQLGLDNYVGNVLSYASIARAGQRPSALISLVEEDTYNIFRIRCDDVSDQVTGSKTVFTLTEFPVMQDKKTAALYPCTEPINIYATVNGVRVEVLNVEPNEKKVLLSSAPQPGAEVLISYAVRTLAPPGYYFFEVTAPNEIYVGKFGTVERQEIYFPIRKVQAFLDKSFFEDNELHIFIDGTELTSGFTINPFTGTVLFTDLPVGTSIQLRDKNGGTLSTYQDWKYLDYEEITLVSEAVGNETYFHIPKPDWHQVDIYLDGVQLTGYSSTVGKTGSDYYIDGDLIFLRKPLPKGSSLQLNIQFYPLDVMSSLPLDTLFKHSSVHTLPSDIEMYPGFFEVYSNTLLVSSDKYEVDYENNILRFKNMPLGDRHFISYRTVNGTDGPFKVVEHDVRNDILPGVRIYFSNMLEVGDKVVVLVGDQRKNCADEYGGKLELNIEMATVSDDPIDAEDLVDKLYMFLWAILKPKFDASGLFIQDVQIGGDSNEEKDTSTSDVDFQNTVSLVMVVDWFYRIPRKMRLLSIESTVKRDPGWEVTGAYLPLYVGGRPYMLYGGDRV